MRFFLVFVLLATSAIAQPAETVRVEDQISIGVGESRIMRFSIPFATITMPVKDVAAVNVLTDQSITLAGQQQGKTLLLVQDTTGRTVYTAMVTVTPDAGRVVKIYGAEHDPGRTAKDYVSFYCTSTTCGRADKDLGNSQPTSTVVRRPLPGGGFVETTR